MPQSNQFNHDEEMGYAACGISEERFDEMAIALAENDADKVSEEIEFLHNQDWSEVEKLYAAIKIGEVREKFRRSAKTLSSLLDLM